MLRRTWITAAASALYARGRNWPLGCNTAVQGYGLFAAIELLRRLEFPVIEIHPMGKPEPVPKVFPGFQFDKLDAADKRKIRAALRPFRLVTTHLPYTGLNWLSPDPAIRAHAVRTIDTALDGSAYFGAKLAVLHPQPLPNQPWIDRRSEYVDGIGRWASRAASLGVRIAIETGFPLSVKDFTDLVGALPMANIGATIDVGHQGRFTDLTSRVPPEDRAKPESIRAYNDTTIRIIETLGKRVFHLHVHDIDPDTWVEHKPMVHGFVDYPRIFAALDRAGYRGALVLEIGGDPEKMPGYLTAARDKFKAWLR
ncbi:MAG: sugar phosphate isomerase/epimerase [Acidobacteria bacterium]|nr:sugar phosphate isomerase/epimerase [Acidobacteriota bacterium]